ncbi:TOBE domain-containing protein [Solimonas marina]|uniref:TOBE domain-containing protein n=1 Tax=Solimonas marina TaxID=2714601 RepID=A0A969W8W3_9GAMM|nr:TOBE domain-containing protein [Solimonas marina]NKF21685.1 TOBE domain-containing protein [Solimonas marina]
MTIAAINSRNQFKGQVVAVHRGSVVSEIEVETAAGIVSAVITTSSVDRLPLRVGDDVLAVFKATEVLVAKLSERA